MERRKIASSPENYIRVGNNFVDLGEWMLQDRSLLHPASSREDASLFVSKLEEPYDLVIVYNSGERKSDVQQCGQHEHEAFSAVTSIPPGQIVFIRGFISPSWVSAIGSKYDIDPEFFRRHMDFLSASIDRHACSTLSLPSSSRNLFRLCVNMLLHRDDFGGQDLQLQPEVFARYR
ncbi:hypothetical protein V8C34DRAFT_293430 [Trichoderma compactum]